ncbi:MAG: xylulokinase [Culicoidibacterales bacterium]
MAYIGIDLGTSAVKIIATTATGLILGEKVKTYQTFNPQKGFSEQNPADWLSATITGLQEIIPTLETRIKGISFSGQMHGLVLLDKDDNILQNAILWNDARTEKQCRFLKETIGPHKIGKWTANQALTGFTAPKILWVKENQPEIFAQIAKIMLPKDYLIYKLSGQFATDVSDASGTLYFDVAARKWSDPMLKLLKIRPNQLPTVYESYQKVGTLLPEVKAIIGVQTEIPIIAGGGDQAVSAIGTGAITAGICSLALGTSGVVYSATTKGTTDKTYQLHSFCAANGGNHLMGVMLAAGDSLKWWYEKILEKKDYSTIDEELSLGRGSVFFLPYLSGERTPLNDSLARGLFIGMSTSTTTADMTLAVLEGISFALKDSFELMRQSGAPINKIRITGGGAKNIIWVQLLANILGQEIELLEVEQGPAFGAAILAMVGTGAYLDVEEATNKLVKIKAIIKPNGALIEEYQQKYQKFNQIYPRVKELYQNLN